MPSIQVRLGNIFDGNSDLVVLPCSAKGTVADWTETHIQNFHLDRPPSGLESDLGRVYNVSKFPGTGNKTKFYAYAASVYNDATSFEALKAIGKRLGELTKENPEIRLIELPLLGTGKGRIKAEVSATALREGFLSSAHPDATMFIKAAQGGVDELQRLFAELALLPSSSTSAMLSHQSHLSRIPPSISESLAAFRSDYPDSKKTAFVMMRFSETRIHQQIFTELKETASSTFSVEWIRNGKLPGDEVEHRSEILHGLVSTRLALGRGEEAVKPFEESGG